MPEGNTNQTNSRAEVATARTSALQRHAGDAFILLLEMQPEIVTSSRTQPPDKLRRNVAALVGCADELGIPVLASVVPLAPGMVPKLIEELADCAAQPRTTVSALDDETVAWQLASSGRKLVAVGGVSTEIALLRTTLSARRLGCEVHLLLDCCGGLDERSERAALRQMEAAGVILSSVPSFLSSLIADLHTAEGEIVMGALAAFWS